MAVSKQQLAQIIGKARDLCSPEGDRLVESYRGQGNSGNNDPDPSQYDDYSQYDSMHFSEIDLDCLLFVPTMRGASAAFLPSEAN